MVNLCGFHQPIACAFTGPPQPTPADAAASSYGQRVLSFLYQELALVGCRLGCPLIPALVRAAVDLAGIPEAIVIATAGGPGAGVLVELDLDAFSALIGQYLTQRLCSTC